VGNNEPIKRKYFAARVKLIVDNDNVRSLFKYKCPENEEYVIIVNSIYKKWMGKTKVVCGKNAERVNGKRVTPYVMEETTITLNKDNEIPIIEYIAPCCTTYMGNKYNKENGLIDLEYDYINQNKRKGKEIDKENRILQEKYKY